MPTSRAVRAGLIDPTEGSAPFLTACSSVFLSTLSIRTFLASGISRCRSAALILMMPSAVAAVSDFGPGPSSIDSGALTSCSRALISSSLNEP